MRIKLGGPRFFPLLVEIPISHQIRGFDLLCFAHLSRRPGELPVEPASKLTAEHGDIAVFQQLVGKSVRIVAQDLSFELVGVERPGEPVKDRREMAGNDVFHRREVDAQVRRELYKNTKIPEKRQAKNVPHGETKRFGFSIGFCSLWGREQRQDGFAMRRVRRLPGCVTSET